MKSQSRIHDLLLSVSHVAELLGVTKRAVYLKIQEGRLVTQASVKPSANGKKEKLVRLGSLTIDAQRRYWDRTLWAQAESIPINLAEVSPSAREEALQRLSVVLTAVEIMESHDHVMPRVAQLAYAHQIR